MTTTLPTISVLIAVRNGATTLQRALDSVFGQTYEHVELLDHDPVFVPELVVDMATGGLSMRPSSRYTIAREVYRARYMHGLETVPAWRSVRLARKLTRIWITRHLGQRTATRIRRIYRFSARKPKRGR